MTSTPYYLRRLVTYLPLLVCGVCEELAGGEITAGWFQRLHRWGTWRHL